MNKCDGRLDRYFWDANETWLVLGAGVLFIAFPSGQHHRFGQSLSAHHLYAVCADCARKAAFDFRVKADDNHKEFREHRLYARLGRYGAHPRLDTGRFITAFGTEVTDYLFTLGIMATVPAVYTLLAACWLIAKTEGELQQKHAHGQIRRGGR